MGTTKAKCDEDVLRGAKMKGPRKKTSGHDRAWRHALSFINK